MITKTSSRPQRPVLQRDQDLKYTSAFLRGKPCLPMLGCCLWEHFSSHGGVKIQICPENKPATDRDRNNFPIREQQEWRSALSERSVVCMGKLSVTSPRTTLLFQELVLQSAISSNGKVDPSGLRKNELLAHPKSQIQHWNFDIEKGWMLLLFYKSLLSLSIV